MRSLKKSQKFLLLWSPLCPGRALLFVARLDLTLGLDLHLNQHRVGHQHKEAFTPQALTIIQLAVTVIP